MPPQNDATVIFRELRRLAERKMAEQRTQFRDAAAESTAVSQERIAQGRGTAADTTRMQLAGKMPRPTVGTIPYRTPEQLRAEWFAQMLAAKKDSLRLEELRNPGSLQEQEYRMIPEGERPLSMREAYARRLAEAGRQSPEEAGARAAAVGMARIPVQQEEQRVLGPGRIQEAGARAAAVESTRTAIRAPEVISKERTAARARIVRNLANVPLPEASLETLYNALEKGGRVTPALVVPTRERMAEVTVQALLDEIEQRGDQSIRPPQRWPHGLVSPDLLQLPGVDSLLARPDVQSEIRKYLGLQGQVQFPNANTVEWVNP